MKKLKKPSKAKLRGQEKRLKKRLEKQADILWHEAIKKKWGNICFFEGSGKEAKEHQKYVKFCHHIKPKGLYYHLRYDLDNGLPCCWPCHFRLEKCDRSMILDVREKRGQKWYSELEKKAKTRLGPSFKTISWYNKQIELLNQYLNV